MEQIGKYEILGILGQGGFGIVYKGYDADLAEEVAIKVFKVQQENLSAFSTTSEEQAETVLKERFLNEARILRSLKNAPQIIDCYDFGRLEEGNPYYVMPYIPTDLKHRLGKDIFDQAARGELSEKDQPKKLSAEEGLPLFQDILTGLAAAHKVGLVHRDIKPSNILLDNGTEVKIADFGIAKVPDSQHSTISSMGIGSRNYMAPEQRISAKHVTAAADVYAVSVLAYRMFTGRLPEGRFQDINVISPGMTQVVNDVIMKGLEQEQNHRFKDAGELLEAFKGALAKGSSDVSSDATGTSTSTDVGGSYNAPVNETIRPLYDILEKSLLADGHIQDIRKQAEAMAHLLSVDDIQYVVDEILDSNKKAKSINRLHNLIASSPNPDADSLMPAASIAGKDKEWVEAQIQRFQGWRHDNDKTGTETGTGTFTQSADDNTASSANMENTGTFSQTLSAEGSNLVRSKFMAIAFGLTVIGAGGYLGWGAYSSYKIDNTAWTEAVNLNTQESYTTYNTLFPNGRYGDEARLKMAQLSVDIQKAKNAADAQQRDRILYAQRALNLLGARIAENGELDTRTQAAVRKFEQDHNLDPSGAIDALLIEEVDKEMDKLDATAWRQAEKGGKRTDYEAYLREWPKGNKVDLANNKIGASVQAAKDNSDYNVALKANTEESYQGYLKAYPSGLNVSKAEGKHAGLVKIRQDAEAKRLQVKMAAQKEEDAWQTTADINNINNYRMFVKQWPKSKFRTNAQAKITEFTTAVENNLKEVIQRQKISELTKFMSDNSDYPSQTKKAKASLDKIKVQERKDFRNLQNKLNFTAVRAYFSNWSDDAPNYTRASSLSKSLETREAQDWDKFQKSPSFQLSNAYFKRWGANAPNHTRADTIRKKLVSQESAAWNAFRKKPSYQAVNTYFNVWNSNAPHWDDVNKAFKNIQNSDTADWERATKINTKANLNSYLKKWGNNGQYSKQAKSRITNLEKAFADDWAKAKSDNSIESLQGFITTWPEGNATVINEAKATLQEAMTEKAAWDTASIGNTLASYDVYIKAYGEGGKFNKNAVDSKERITRQMEDEWNLAKNADTIDAYTSYVQKWPEAPAAYVTEASSRQKAIQDAAIALEKRLAEEASDWQNATAANKISTYKSYQTKWREGGKYLDEARTKIAAIETKIQSDWSVANKDGSSKAYSDFLAKWLELSGDMKKQAETALAAAKKKEAKKKSRRGIGVF